MIGLGSDKNNDKDKVQTILNNFVILLISHDKSRNSYYVIDRNDMTAFPILFNIRASYIIWKNQNRSFVDNVKGVLDQYFAYSENHQIESTGSKYKKAKFVYSKFTLIELRLRKSLANWRFWEKEVEKCCAFDFFVVLQLCGFGSTKAAMSEISFPKLSCNVLLGSTGRANMFLSFQLQIFPKSYYKQHYHSPFVGAEKLYI